MHKICSIGVGLVTRKLANMTKPVTEISILGDQWTIKTITPIKTVEATFKLGTEFDEVTLDGRKVKTTVTLEGQKLTCYQKGDPDSILVREFIDNKMILWLTAKGVTCKRIYKRKEE
ncbi:hypothetical protein CHS0354_007611 [Potamilus streckersoni]|uniref:Lipocalin/cytosolic fatty-acid binding domain-containing protein n=1 Tax=Potamilus streckersoni TaxID=2493646 RepID=A0AAE0T4T5_9BIVA|nr:hypothetical protein CHS0354_007611 [Potamilus streckersoni]